MKPIFKRAEATLDNLYTGSLVTRLQNSPNYYYVVLGLSFVANPTNPGLKHNLNVDYLRFGVGGEKLTAVPPKVTSGSMDWLRLLNTDNTNAISMAETAVMIAIKERLYNHQMLSHAFGHLRNMYVIS